MANSSASQSNVGAGLTGLLNSLQQGVAAINNATQTMKTIFPSSS